MLNVSVCVLGAFHQHFIDVIYKYFIRRDGKKLMVRFMQHFCLFVSEMEGETENDQDVSVKSKHPPKIHI